MVQMDQDSTDGPSSPVPHSILKHFDLAPAVYPWTDDRVHEIKGRRAERNELFIDLLLGLAGLDATALYPPTTLPSLRRLLAAILTSSFDRLKRDCLLYYLLLDYSTTSTDRKRADGFARQRCVPKMWTCFVQGYWELDQGLWEAAVVHLSDPRLIPDFIPKVLETLATLPPPELSATLVRRYILFTDPPLDTARERDIKLRALCEADLVKAWEYMRQVRAGSLNEEEEGEEDEMEDVKRAPNVDSEQEADRMLRGILDYSLIPSPRPQALSSLLNLPLTHHEHTQLLAYLNRPSASIPHASMSILHDLVTLRLIHQGRYAEVIQLDRDLAASASGGEQDRQRRREMVRDLVAVLPEVQRNILLVDRDEQEDLSMSWEVVPSPAQPGMPNDHMKNGTLPLSATDAFRASTRPNDAVLQAIVQNQPLVNHIRDLSAANPTVAALASAIPLPSSPGIASAAARPPHSPFAGPPRFANSLANGHGPSPRKPSAPVSVGAATPTPVAPALRRLPSVNGSARSASPAPSVTPAPPVFKPVKTRHFGWGEPSGTPSRAEPAPAVDSREAYDAAGDMEQGGDSEPEPEPEPEPARRSTRKGKAKANEAETSPTPATTRATRARSARQASAAPTLPVVEEKGTGSMPGALPDSDLGSSRIRRSASRALLETDEEDSKRGGKRNRNAAGATDDIVSLRRSTRRAATASRGSERGSPTPSVTKTPSRRKTRATSTDETPRAGMRTRRQASAAMDD